MDCEFMNLQE